MEQEFKLIDDPTTAANLLWNEYAFRQGHYWRSTNRFGLAIITLWVVPYIRPELVAPRSPVGMGIAILPVLLSLCATWLLNAEYIRLRETRLQYNNVLGVYAPCRWPDPKSLWERFKTAQIGPATTRVFLLGFGSISLINLFIFVWHAFFNIALVTPKS